MAKPNPEIMKWARESSGLSLEDAAKKLSLKSSKQSGAAILLAYESGEAEPTSKKINDMSKVYHRPLLTFYLQSPPEVQKKGEDYRTIPDSVPIDENGNVDAIVRDIFVRQSIVREAMIDSDDAERKDFVGSLKKRPDIYEACSYIKERFSISPDEFKSFRTAHDSMSYLRKKIELEGIFVLLIGNLGSHHSSVSTSYFRGFAIADDIAPFIVINDNDSKKAWSFTLLHELAHILIGETGISNSGINHEVEKYCNDVASTLLLPHDDLMSIEINDHFNFEDVIKTIQDKADYFNVSNSLIAYRLLRAGKIDEYSWEKLSSHFKDRWIQSKLKSSNDSKSGGSYYVTKRHKTGNALIRIVRNSILEGVITETKAGKVLGVSPGNVARMVEL